MVRSMMREDGSKDSRMAQNEDKLEFENYKIMNDYCSP